jgi:two-component system sensor histidine kinase KdpD
MPSPDSRPDPDTLLAQIHSDEARAGRGKLRIYFGSSAGVGKTYAMLLAARHQRSAGVDVVAGVIETHGRGDTQAQVGDLRILPPAQVPYRGRTLSEFDLDGALQRKPALILVDELAHSNVAGSRHPKRWQDVEELLDAGIDVWSTLNVQHLESLNDVVGGITGIRVQETLPDTFFDRADEVVLVDTPADELIARLKAGKVYLPAQAERAGRNFFRKGNLMALRELALRRTADRVEDDVQAYRVEQSIDRVWKTEAAFLCCIGAHDNSNHVVRSAARLAQQLAVGWHAVYAETPALQRLDNAQRERILRTVKLARDLGATTAVLSSQDVAAELIGYARQHNLSKLVLGHTRRAAWWRGPTLAHALTRLAPDVDLIEVGQGQAADAQPERSERSAKGGDDTRPDLSLQRAVPYLWALAACAVTTLLAHPLQPIFDLANIVMLFLLAVVGVAVRFGRGPAVLAAFLNVAAFDFFFVAPQMSFNVSDVQYLFTFAVMLVVGLVVGQLTAGLRFQADVAKHREGRSRALFEVARDLSQVLLREQVIEVAEKTIAQAFRAQARVFALDPQERLQLHPHAGDASDASAGGAHAANGSSGLDLGTAQWSLDHNEAAGLGTDTLAGSGWLYLPLKTPMRARGVLAVRPTQPRLLLVPEQRQQLETFAALLAVALERVHYVDVAQTATVQMESERLRNSLLSALSHDLRTPLAAIYGTSDLLVAETQGLPAAPRELAMSIATGARRMHAMVGNLLDMARLQSGTVQLNLQWQPIEEVVGSALQAISPALAGHHVVTDVANGLPLVQFDAVLIERVLCNLLENAAKYTPKGSTVTLSARLQGDDLVVAVADDGPGLPTGREEALFEKFARGERESATPGVGLGLAICRAIIDAHHGRIWVEPGNENVVGGGAQRGARFLFTLPLGTPPEAPLPEADEVAQHG